MAGNGPIEPSADLRAFARSTHEMFVALTLEGFTEAQALAVIGQFIAVAMAAGGDSNA